MELNFILLIYLSSLQAIYFYILTMVDKFVRINFQEIPTSILR